MRILKSFLCLIFLAVFVEPLFAQEETYTWGNVAIGGGGFVTGIIPSTTEEGLLYARTDVGGAYRWDESNSKWIPLNDWISEDQVGYLGVESLATDPTEPNRLYMLVGTSYFNDGKTAILRSSDYGETFQITEVTSQFTAHGNGMGRQTGEKLQVDPNSNNILFCGTRDHGLFKSTDYGSNWSKVESLEVGSTDNTNGISFVLLDPSSSSEGSPTQMIVIGLSAPGANFFISQDGGASFSVVEGAPNSNLMPHRAAMASDGTIYVTYVNAAGPWDITGSGEVWKYNPETGEWTDISPTAPIPYGGIDVSPDDPNKLILTSINKYLQQDDTYGDQIYISSDAGASWTDIVTEDFSLDENGITWIDGNAIHWAGDIKFDPFDASTAYVISGNGIWETTDVEASEPTWSFMVDGLEETVPLDIASIPNGPLVTVIGDYDGFTHSDIEEYAPIHEPNMGTTTGLAVASLNPDIRLRTGQEDENNGLIYLTKDGGASWQEISSEGIKGTLAVSADGKTFYHTPESSPITYQSTAEGATWQELTNVGITNARIVTDKLNADKLYAYNPANGDFVISEDGGTSFEVKNTLQASGSKIIRVNPYQEGDVWVPLYEGGLVHTSNGGDDFTAVEAITYCGAVGFGKAKEGNEYPTLFIWGTIDGTRGIYRSIDKGATWTRVNDDAHQYGGPGNGQFVVGDMNVFGRVYMSTVGRGLVYGESNLACEPTKITPEVEMDGEAQQGSYLNLEGEGAAVTLGASGVDENGTFTWTGPNDFSASTASISFESVTLAESGTYFLQYTDPNGCESALQAYVMEVSVMPTSISLSTEGGASGIDTQGGSIQLVASFNPENATEREVIWSVSDESLATITQEGLLEAIADGTVTVTATSTADPTISGTIEIAISNQSVLATTQMLRESIQVYPNPVKDLLSIQAKVGLKQANIWSLRGEQIMQKSLQGNQASLATATWPKGFYIIELTTENNDRIQYNLIKD